MITASRPFPHTRLRRLRKHDWLRKLTQEYQLTAQNLILPLFIHAEATSIPITSFPSIKRYCLDDLITICRQAQAIGIKAIALFPVLSPSLKNSMGTAALAPNNLITQALQRIRYANLDLGVICDCALDPYTDHGHDGILQMDGDVDNDGTIAILAQQAVQLANAGADIIAPSDMQDGRIGAIRKALDSAGQQEVSILSYTAKYASLFYNPFRNAIDANGLKKIQNPKQRSDKKSYQMNPANRAEAIHIANQHLQEGADCLMVKPAMGYLDIVLSLHQNCQVPIFAYQVSGEYVMMHAYATQQSVNLTHILYESLLSCRRAGAQAIFTYGALQIAQTLSTTL